MNMKKVIILSAILHLTISVFLLGCKTEDPKAEALRTLTETDRLWCQSASTDLDEFISFLDEDVVWLFCNHPKLHGKEAVRAFFIRAYENNPFTFTWTPDKIEVSNSGELGYTYGTYSLVFLGSAELQPEIIRDYATVWRKQSDDEWKVVLEADF
jgi:ketosteroid isomerase-like protein